MQGVSMKQTLIFLGIFFCIPAMVPTKTTIDLKKTKVLLRYFDFPLLKILPGDLKQYIILMIATGHPTQATRGICTAAALNKRFHSLMNNPEKIIMILDALAYTVHGINVAYRLKNKTATMPVMQSKQIKDRLIAACEKLEHQAELYEAISDNNITQMKQLLAHRNIDLGTCIAYSVPFSFVVRFERTEIARLLLSAGAKDSYGNNGYTALMAAAEQAVAEFAENRNTRAIKFLLGLGVNVDAQDDDGQTALIWSVLKGALYENLATLNDLMRSQRHDSMNDFLRAFELPNIRAETVKLLLDAGANPAIRNKENKSALDYAREKGNHEAIRLLEDALKLPTGKRKRE